MPASVKAFGAVNDIIGGQGDVSLAEALVAATTCTGIAMFAKRIGLWPKFTPVEQHEAEMLDEDMPAGWWHETTQTVAASAVQGKKTLWQRGPWGSRHTANGSVVVVTPALDEDADTLIQ